MAAPAYDQDILPGFVVSGRYRVERMLGRGGMGSVYAALHLQLGQYVALKVLNAQSSRDADAVARFNQEAQVISRLSSPHVVRVFDMGQTQRGEPFLVMELLQGRDLDAVINDPRQLTIGDAVRYVVQACAGAATAHAAGLVHRDLKPANLFLARQPEGIEMVKVLDFGLTKVTTGVNVGLTQSASSFGTPQYMSPEQIMSSKHVDARCDQHALALILYELLTKKPAYEADTPGAITVKIVTEKVPSSRYLRAEIPQKLDEAIQKAMAKRPADRFANVGAFAQAIAPFGEPGLQPFADALAARLKDAPGLVQNDALSLPSTPAVSAHLTEGSFSRGTLRRARSSGLYLGAGAAIALVGVAIAVIVVMKKPEQPTNVAETTATSPTGASPGAKADRDPQPMVPASSSATKAEPPTATSPSGATSVQTSGPAAPTTTASAAVAPKPPTPGSTNRVIPSSTSRATNPPGKSDPFTVFGGGH